MVGLAAALLLAQPRPKVDTPTLEFYQDRFVVRTQSGVQFLPIRAPKPEPQMGMAFRRNEHFAVWDERGLTVRHGARSRISRLPEMSVSPRFFSPAEIRETVRLIDEGRRSRDASSLSGAVRAGKYAYFLVRWEDSREQPWAELLVRVLLDGTSLWPEVVGRFEGTSLAYKDIDDRLFILADRLAVVTRRQKKWGVASFDPGRKSFSFRALGNELLTYMPTGRKNGLFAEKTGYGTVQAGRIDLGSGQRIPIFEARSNSRFLDTERPMVVVSSSAESARLHNGETGAQLTIPSGSGVGRIGDRVLVWTPMEAPKSAVLYTPDRWRPVARWRAD